MQFGEEGLDRANKLLKQQLSTSNARISSLEWEKKEREDKLEEALRNVKNERERAEALEVRVENAEDKERTLKEELSQSRLNVSNYEVRLQAESLKVADLEKDIKRLEYHLDSAAMEGSSHTAQDDQLRTKLKLAEEDARRARTELAQLHAQQAAGSNGPSPRTSRRRVSSFNGAELSSVTSERDAATGAIREAQAQIETLERKLAAAVQERDQAVNARMALQKKADKEIEEAKDRATELQYELDARAFGELPSTMEKQNTKLRTDLKSSLETIQTLEDSKKQLQEEIDGLRQHASVTTSDSDNQEARIVELTEQVSSLQAALATSRSQSPFENKNGDGPTCLQRELKAAKRKLEVKEREIESLEQDLLDANEEIEALRAGSSHALPHDSDGADRILELEARVQSVGEELETARSESEKAQADLAMRLAEVSTQLQESNSSLEAEKDSTVKLRSDLEASRAKSEAAQQLEKDIAAAQARVVELEEALQISIQKLADVDQALSTSQEQSQVAQQERDELKSSLAEKDALLSEISSKRDEIAAKVERQSEDVEALEVARKQLVMQEQRISDLESQQSGDKDTAVRLSKAQREVATLKDKVEALQTSMAEMETHLSAEIEAVSAHLAAKEEELGLVKRTVEDETSLKETIGRLQSDLQEKVTSLDTITATHSDLEAQILQMTATIQRLRIDRDDIKSQLRFAEAETKFSTEAESDLASERDALQCRISTLETSLECLTAITSERDDLADNIKLVEGERDVTKQKLDELADTERTLSETLEAEQDRRRTAETRVEELLLTATVGEMPDDERTREIKALFERIGRREARIKVLTKDLKKLQMNHAVAQDDVKELNEEIETLQQSILDGKEADAKVQEELSQVKTTNAEVQDELATAKAEGTSLLQELSAERANLAAQGKILSQLEARYSALSSDYEFARMATTNNTRDLVLAIAIYRKGIVSATEHRVSTEHALQATIAKVSQLEAEQAALLQRGSGINELREQLAASEQELKETTAKLAGSEIAAADLAIMKTQRAELDARVEELESDLATSHATLSDVEAKASLLEKELVDANNRLAEVKAEHETSVADFNRRLVDASDDFASRTADLNAQHESALSETRNQLETSTAEAEARLVAAEERLSSAQTEIAAAIQRHEETSLELETTKSERDTIAAQAEELARTANMVEGLRADITRLESELSEAAATSKADSDRIEDLIAQLSMATSDKAALDQELSTALANIDELAAKESELLRGLEVSAEALASERAMVAQAQADLEDKHTTLAAAEKENRSSTSRLRFMESQVKELTQRIADLRDDLDTVNSGTSAATRIAADRDGEITRLKKERTALKSQVEALNDDLQRAYASLTTKTNEIEDADDRQQELSKEIARQKKRLAKVERQNKSLLSELETTRNTLDNVSPARVSAPRPPVAHLETGTPKHKRSRDEEERQVPREVWVQAAPKGEKSPAVGRSPLAVRAVAGSNRPIDRPIAGKKRTGVFSVAERMAALPQRGALDAR